MKAITQQEYGDAGVLRLTDIDAPAAPGKGEVLVDVRAVGVGPETIHIVAGDPLMVRLGTGIRRPRKKVPGRDVAGVVVAVGPDVEGFAVGDEVLGTSISGSFAEQALCLAKRLAHKPSDVSWVDAAALPISGGTALDAVEAGRIGEGARVLVIGAGGGVGAYAVQLAALRGATVTGVCSAGKADLVRSLGATDVIDYRVDEVDRDGAVYDVVLDCAGNRPLSVLKRAVAEGGSLIVVGGDAGKGALLGGFQRGMLSPVYGLFARRRMVGLMSTEKSSSYAELSRLVAEGSLRVVLDRTYPLADAAEAVRHVAGGHNAGKTVVTI